MRTNPDFKRILWKICALLLVIAGVCLMAYPFLRERLQEKTKDTLLESWKQELTALDETEDTSEISENTVNVHKTQLAGELKIAAIDLDLPVIKGATKEHLAISCCLMETDAILGEIGTTAIAGHHSSTYGRHFNRLGELVRKDEMVYQTAQGSYTYEIDQIQVVEPEDVWVLESDGRSSRLTLITCYYAKDGTTKRLIVSGKLVES